VFKAEIGKSSVPLVSIVVTKTLTSDEVCYKLEEVSLHGLVLGQDGRRCLFLYEDSYCGYLTFVCFDNDIV